MINPVINSSVVDGALKVFFPAAHESAETSAYVQKISYSLDTYSRGLTAVCSSLVQKVCEHYPDISKVRKSTRDAEVAFVGDYVGIRNIDLPRVNCARGFVRRSVRASAMYEFFPHYYAQDGFSVGVDAYDVRAQLNLYKMRVFEASESRRRALDFMYDFLEDAFEERDVLMIDHMLLLASSELVDHSLSVSFLRATSRARKHLTFWKLFEGRVRLSLKDNPNAHKLLKGLD
ncbi:hypothetical protein [Pseudomonas sp. ICMP 460]|uniref:hypothetical protein n=1 Tax=Pseudomonas sp. ICMP 460 TaxID=1718917 RepID=UPI00117B0C70|nr:hypothetical protein [Pseudomonas sp. ICMP 460]